MRMRFDLVQLETFLSVMELGSITATANRFNISKSVISKRIRDFEQAIGTALFRRHAGRLTPTDVGLDLAEELRPALVRLMAAAENAGAREGAPLRGTLSIAAPISFGSMFLSPVLAEFAARHPGLEIHVDYDDRLRDLAREGYDVGIRIGEARDGALRFRILHEDRQVVVASPDYLERAGTPKDIHDLRQHEVLRYSHVADAEMWQFRRDGRNHVVPVSGRMVLNNGEALRDMAVAGLGLVMVPHFIAAKALADGRLLALLPEYETRRLPVMAVWPPVSPMPRKIRLLVDFLHQQFRGGLPTG